MALKDYLDDMKYWSKDPPPEQKKSASPFPSMLLTFVLVFFLFIYGCYEILSRSARVAGNEIPIAVRKFIGSDPAYSQIRDVEYVENWACGPRVQGRLDDMFYLFYIENDEVVGLWMTNRNGEKTQIWGKPNHKSCNEPNLQRQEFAGIDGPYTILETVHLLKVGKHADVLVPWLSRSDFPGKRRQVLENIIKEQQLYSAEMFCDEHSWQVSKHPGSARTNTCFLASCSAGNCTTY